MRIGLFTDTYTPEINGVVSSIVLLQQELEKNGHDVFVVTTNNNLFETEREGNVLRLPGVEIKQLYGYIMTSPIHFAAMQEVEEMNLELIHAHTEFGVGIFARLVARRLNIPLVSTYHTTYEDYTHYVNPTHLKTVDKLARKAVANLSKLYGSTCVEMISPSEKTKEMLIRYGIKTPINVIPTGIDLSRFDRSNTTGAQRFQTRASLGIERDEFLLLFVGRIAKEKSIEIPIEAFKYLSREEVAAKLVIVGGGPDIDSLYELVDEYHIKDKVIFVGKKPASEVPSFYHAADGFVSASLTETQGLTFIEALASELPVFARPDDVVTDLVIEGKTGYLFETGFELAEKIKKYMSITDSRKVLFRERAKKQVQPYDSRIFYNRVIEMYKRSVNTYHNYLEVTSIKAKKDYIELKVENRDESLKLLVDLDTYMQENIRLGSKLNSELIELLKKQEEKVKAFEACVRKLAIKDYTRKEMYDYLTQKTDLEIGQINEIIASLEEKGYVDDLRYARSTITSMQGLLQGEHKIYRTLKKKGVPLDIIDETLAMHKDNDNELNNAILAAEKLQASIKEKSIRRRKQLIYQGLMNRGFDVHIIEESMSHLKFVDEEKEELDNLRKIAYKAKKRYGNQHSGVKLRNLVFRYCSAQGFDMEDIYLVLSELDWEE